jgi:tetratricopeptide (TPR) repeat protein
MKMRSTLLLIAACVVLVGCSGKNSLQGGSDTSSLNGTGPGASAISVEGGAKGQAQAYIEKGNELYNNDNDQGAAQAFEQAVQLDPESAEAHFKLGRTYYVMGRRDDAEKQYQEAVDAYQRQLRSKPDDPQGQYNLAEAYNRLGKPAEAAKALKEAVRMAPDDSDYYFELGTTHMKLAQYQEAVSAFQKATDLDPDNARAAESLESAKDNWQRKKAALKQIDDQLKKKNELKRIPIGGGLPPAIKKD